MSLQLAASSFIDLCTLRLKEKEERGSVVMCRFAHAELLRP